MRFFRIPSFTGIEAHRDDADRGSLRVVEGCLPYGPGGLRSGPVWKPLGDLTSCSTTEVNQVQGVDDAVGNSFVFSTRNCTVNDMGLFSKNGTEIESVEASYDLAIPPVSIFNEKNAVISSIGNRAFVVGDGSSEAIPVGLDPANLPSGSEYGVQPDYALYSEEWSRFPKCQYYARGPKGAIYAAGNPDKPLTVYVSEPAGKTAPWRDSPYSTEFTSQHAGQLSTVDILGSDASRITALSTRGEQVVVHTDKGSFILFAPSADQAITGYRVEQVPATNFSAAVNHQVVSGEGGTQTFWLGHDGQVYKDESSSRGSVELQSYGDEDQANWKSKGAWEFELPDNLENSFATFEAQSGNYIFFTEEKNYNSLQGVPYKPLNPNAKNFTHLVLGWVYKGRYGISQFCDCEDALHCSCCRRVNTTVSSSDPLFGAHETLQACLDATGAEGRCCSDSFISGCCNWYEPGDYELVDCECVEVARNLRGLGVGMSLEACENSARNNDRCISWDPSDFLCACEGRRYGEGAFETIEECRDYVAATDNCGYDLVDCTCQKHNVGGENSNGQWVGGEFVSLGVCENYLLSVSECKKYERVGCECLENPLGDMYKEECEAEVALDQSCWLYEFSSCENGCTQTATGTLSQVECDDLYTAQCITTVYEYSGCDSGCSETYLSYGVSPTSSQYNTFEECNTALANDISCKTYDVSNCVCVENTQGSGTYSGENALADCLAAKENDPACNSYEITDCECVLVPGGTYESEELCLAALDVDPGCAEPESYAVSSGNSCECVSVPFGEGSFTTIEACEDSLDETCFTTYRQYKFLYDTSDTAESTVVHSKFGIAESSVNTIGQLLAGFNNQYETDDTVTPQETATITVWFGLYIEAQEGYIYELLVPKPGLNNSYTLYSSDLNDANSDGLLRLNAVQTFSHLAEIGTDYSTDVTNENTPLFRLTKKAMPVPMYNFIGCDNGLAGACFEDPEGTLTLEECTQKYDDECMSSSDCDATNLVYSIDGPDCVCDETNGFYTECDCIDGGFPITSPCGGSTGSSGTVSYDAGPCGYGCDERPDDQGQFATLDECNAWLADNCE